MTDRQKALEWFKNRRTAVMMSASKKMHNEAVKALEELEGQCNPTTPNRKDYPPFSGKPIPNKWVWSEDNGEPFRKCPKCDCGMNPYDYSHAVGTRGWSFCPYCGEDLRKVEPDEPRQLTIMDFLGKEDGA